MFGFVDAHDNKNQQTIDVITRLRRESQWQHLDAKILERIDPDSKFGPEVNVRVTVLDKDGTPRSDVLVVLCESASDLVNDVRISPSEWNTLEVPLAVQVPDAKGITHFAHVRRTHPGFIDDFRIANVATAQILVIAPDRAWVGVQLQPTSMLQEVTIQLEDQGELIGKVVGPDNQSIVGGEIRMSEWSNQNSGSSRNPAAISVWNSSFVPRCKTESDGTYRLKGIPKSGWARISARHPEFVQFGDRDNRSVELNKARRDFTFIKSEYPKRTFRVVDAVTKQPISGVRIPLRISETKTGDDGRFSTNLYVPAYSLDPNKKLFTVYVEPINEYFPTHFVFENFALENDVIDIPLSKGRLLKGRVVDASSGMGLPDVALRISETTSALKERYSTGTSYFFYNVISQADGSFEAIVPPMNLTVQLDASVYGYETKNPPPKLTGQPSSDIEFESNAQSIDAGKADPFDEVVFRLEPVKPIRGLAVDSNRKPIANLLVTSTVSMDPKAWKSQATTNAKGEFVMLPPPGAARELHIFSTQDGEVVSKKIQLTPNGSYIGKPVVLNFAEANPVQFISGLIFLNGEPARDVVVNAYEQRRSGGGGGLTTRTYGRANFLGSAQTDETGRYRIPVLNAASSEVDILITSPSLLADSSWNHKSVSLRGEETEVPPMEFRTRYGDLTVKGEVITPEGDPVVGATIHAIVEERNIELLRDRRRQEPSPETDTSATTDENGVFVCRNLCEGRIQLQIRTGKAEDTWANSVFQSIYTTGGTEGLVVVMDPDLAAPPQVITPLKTTPLPEFVDPFRESKATSEKGFTIRGTIIDSSKMPIENVSVVIFAAKQNDSDIPSVQPVHHPLCGLKTQSDSSGKFELHVPQSNVSIRFYAGKPGYGAKVSGYLYEDTQWNVSLSKIMNPQSSPGPDFGHSTTILDDKKQPVPNALVVAMQDYDQLTEPDQLGNAPSAQLSVTDENGGFAFAGESVGDWKAVIRPGLAFRLMEHGPPKKAFVSRGFSITGRIVDANGPVAGYPVCASSISRMLTHRVLTDANGVFRLEGLTTTFTNGPTELYIYGDANRRDTRGWLRTRIISSPKQGEHIQLDDCRLDRNGSLRVAMVDASGVPLQGNMTIDCRLRQHSIPLTLALKDVSEQEFLNLPSEPIILNFRPARGAEVTMVEPTQHRVGFQFNLCVALEPGDNSELNLTILQRQ